MLRWEFFSLHPNVRYASVCKPIPMLKCYIIIADLPKWNEMKTTRELCLCWWWHHIGCLAANLCKWTRHVFSFLCSSDLQSWRQWHSNRGTRCLAFRSSPPQQLHQKTVLTQLAWDWKTFVFNCWDRVNGKWDVCGTQLLHLVHWQSLHLCK